MFFSNGVRDEQDGQQTIFVDFTATKNCPSYRFSLFLTAFIFSSRSTVSSFLRRIVFHAGNSPARNSPQIQTGNAAIRAEPPAVFFKQLAVYCPVVVDHTQPALDCQIVKAEYVRPLQAEQQNHFRCPYADSFQRSQRLDCFVVWQLGNFL